MHMRLLKVYFSINKTRNSDSTVRIVASGSSFLDFFVVVVFFFFSQILNSCVKDFCQSKKNSETATKKVWSARHYDEPPEIVSMAGFGQKYYIVARRREIILHSADDGHVTSVLRVRACRNGRARYLSRIKSWVMEKRVEFSAETIGRKNRRRRRGWTVTVGHHEVRWVE